MDKGKMLDFPMDTGGQASADEPPAQLQVIGIEPRFVPINAAISMDDIVNLIAAGWLYWATLPVIPSVKEQLSGASTAPVVSHVFYRPVLGPVN